MEHLPSNILNSIFAMSGNIKNLSLTCRRFHELIAISEDLMDRLTLIWIESNNLENFHTLLHSSRRYRRLEISFYLKLDEYNVFAILGKFSQSIVHLFLAGRFLYSRHLYSVLKIVSWSVEEIQIIIFESYIDEGFKEEISETFLSNLKSLSVYGSSASILRQFHNAKLAKLSVYCKQQSVQSIETIQFLENQSDLICLELCDSMTSAIFGHEEDAANSTDESVCDNFEFKLESLRLDTSELEDFSKLVGFLETQPNVRNFVGMPNYKLMQIVCFQMPNLTEVVVAVKDVVIFMLAVQETEPNLRILKLRIEGEKEGDTSVVSEPGDYCCEAAKREKLKRNEALYLQKQDEALAAFVSLFPSIETLKLLNIRIGFKLQSILTLDCSKLNWISCNSTTFTNIMPMPTVKKADISNVDSQTAIDFINSNRQLEDIQLQDVKIDNCHLESILKHTKNLQYLDISGCYRVESCQSNTKTLAALINEFATTLKLLKIADDPRRNAEALSIKSTVQVEFVLHDVLEEGTSSEGSSDSYDDSTESEQLFQLIKRKIDVKTWNILDFSSESSGDADYNYDDSSTESCKVIRIDLYL